MNACTHAMLKRHSLPIRCSASSSIRSIRVARPSPGALRLQRAERRPSRLPDPMMEPPPPEERGELQFDDGYMSEEEKLEGRSEDKELESFLERQGSGALASSSSGGSSSNSMAEIHSWLFNNRAASICDLATRQEYAGLVGMHHWGPSSGYFPSGTRQLSPSIFVAPLLLTTIPAPAPAAVCRGTAAAAVRHPLLCRTHAQPEEEHQAHRALSHGQGCGDRSRTSQATARGKLHEAHKHQVEVGCMMHASKIS